MVVTPVHARLLDDGLALDVGDGAYLAEGEEDLGALDHGRSALLVEERDEGFARAELHDSVLGLESGIGAEGLGRGLDDLLLLGAICAQCMLYAVAELAGDVVRHVGRILCDEIDADALASDQSDDLLDLADQGLRSVVEEGVGLVEEEHELGQVHVSDLGQLGVEVAHEPEEESGIKLGIEH